MCFFVQSQQTIRGTKFLVLAFEIALFYKPWFITTLHRGCCDLVRMKIVFPPKLTLSNFSWRIYSFWLDKNKDNTRMLSLLHSSSSLIQLTIAHLHFSRILRFLGRIPLCKKEKNYDSSEDVQEFPFHSEAMSLQLLTLRMFDLYYYFYSFYFHSISNPLFLLLFFCITAF